MASQNEDDTYVKKGFTLKETTYKDLDLYFKDHIGMIVMKKFKADKKASRQSGNHLDGDIILELINAFSLFEKNKDIHSIILASAQKFVYSRGAKIEIMLGATAENAKRFIIEAQKLITNMQQMTKPIIAAINGLTFGGALELIMGCDYRVSSTRNNVFFGLPEASLGIIPAMGGTQNSTFLVGKEKAYEIMMGARADITPDEALKIKLVDELCEHDDLIDTAIKYAVKKDLKKRFPHAKEPAAKVNREEIVKEAKEFLKNHKINIDPSKRGAPLSRILLEFMKQKTDPSKYLDGLIYEQEVCTILQQTADCQEGLTALIEERTPNFKGR